MNDPRICGDHYRRRRMRVTSIFMVAVALSLAFTVKAVLVAKWKFNKSNPDPAWSSDYVVSPPADIHDPGVYTIGSNPNSAHSAWASFGPQGGDLILFCTV